MRETALRNLARIRGEDKDLFIRTRRAISALAGEERSRQALQVAATEDEDVQVRWAARYALRLAERETSTDAAGPASG